MNRGILVDLVVKHDIELRSSTFSSQHSDAHCKECENNSSRQEAADSARNRAELALSIEGETDGHGVVVV